MEPFDPSCERRPAEIDEYVELAEEAGVTPDEFVRDEEGTYNEANGHFLCTSCYIDAGAPVAAAGWVCP